MTCETCRFWDDHGDEEDAKPREGDCLRFPPVRNDEPRNDYTAMFRLWSFPVTGGHWLCGEFQASETT